MRFRRNFFLNYLKEAPVPLALERSLECAILSTMEFVHPILDMGCGEGLFAYILFDEEIDVGIEPNDKELKRAKEYGIYKELINCYGDNIPKEGGSFNTIFSNSVLEHISELEPVIKEAHRLLSDGGMFYVTVPTDLFDRFSILYQLMSKLKLYKAAEKYRQFFNRFWRHYNYYSPKDWQILFEKTGFTVKKQQEYCAKKTCIINDFLAYFAMPSFIKKKIFNRWFLFEPLRDIITPLLYFIYRPLLRERAEDLSQGGGIVFFALVKTH